MSSCVDGGAEIVGGVGLLAVGLPVAAVFGVGWVAYQSGAAVVSAVNAINRAVDEHGERVRLEQQMRRQRAETARARVVGLLQQFIAEANAQLREVTDPAAAAQLQSLITRTEGEVGRTAGAVEQLEAANVAAASFLQEAVRKKNALLRRQEVQAGALGQFALGQLTADLLRDLQQVPTEGVVQVKNITARTPGQVERGRLWARYEQAALSVRQAVLRESAREGRFPLSDGHRRQIHSIFHGMEKRIAALNDPAASNGDLFDGIRRLEECMDRYRHLAQVLDEAEAEFAALYGVYTDVAKALELPLKQPADFADAEALKEQLQRCRKQVERAEFCGKLLGALGEDAYLCLAFDTEMRDMGYSVLDSRQVTSRLGQPLDCHVCPNGMAVPVYDLPDGAAVTQMYSIDEHCSLQLIVHPDGTTTLQTIMEGSDTAETVESQRRHCDRAGELAARLRKNWFVKCDLMATASAEQVRRAALVMDDDRGIRRNERGRGADPKYFRR